MIRFSGRIAAFLTLYCLLNHVFAQPAPEGVRSNQVSPGSLASEVVVPKQITSNMLITIEDGDHLGVIDGDGDIIIPIQYDNLGPWGDGMIAVNQGAEGVAWGRRGGKWGFADESGELRVPVKFDEVHPLCIPCVLDKTN